MYLLRMRNLALACLLLVLCSSLNRSLRLAAQEQPASVRSDDDKRAYRAAMEQADQKISDEVKAHSELMKNLEYLTTQIGARLTGSPQMNRASQWTLERFKDYGIDAHLETIEIPHSWTRGDDTAELLAPVKKEIEIRSAGWSKATPGAVTGNVLFLSN